MIETVPSFIALQFTAVACLVMAWGFIHEVQDTNQRLANRCHEDKRSQPSINPLYTDTLRIAPAPTAQLPPA